MTAPRLDDLPLPRRSRLRRLKEVPVLPSLITLGNLFFGFLAIAKVADALRTTAPGAPFAAVVGMFETAAILVFVAMVFDALDGRVARMTGQTTPFGAQLDSMADMVTFGLAPAFLAKVLVDWHAQGDTNKLLPLHPKLFFAAAAVYSCCAALRLARFNVETGADEEDHREFKGLPSPAAAAVICSLIALFCTRADKTAELSHRLLGERGFDWIVISMPVALVLTGLLMVSRIPFPHALSALMRGRHSLPMLAVLAVVMIVAAVEWQLALATCTLGYVVWGMGLGAYRLVLRRRDDDDDADEPPVRSLPSRN
ncbi:MAG: CDP-alcohol phosphatidyltransferase family protein [Planctomycetota bacterium]|jgi:CDP-diacylglycerol--serine O-phosphatidyltransferase